jgi:Mrp family chromosome partitioning ATPase
LEPISYLGAPRRRWPVIVGFVLVGMIGALLYPVHTASAYPPNTWRSYAEVGLTPAYKANGLGAKLGLEQLEFFAHEPIVITAAANSVGVPVTKKLINDVETSKSKKGKKSASGGTSGSVLYLAVLQQSKAKAVKLTNAFVSALDSYAQLQLTNEHNNSINSEERYITNLQNTIASLSQKTKTPKPTTTTTTRPSTIHPRTKPPKTRTKPKKAAKAKAKAPKTTDPTSTTSTTAAASLGTTARDAQLTALAASDSRGSAELSAPRYVLVQDVSNVTTTIPGSSAVPGSGTTGTSIPGATTPGSTSGSGSSSTNAEVAAERRVLINELAHQTAALVKLKSQGAPQTGLRVITPAAASSAVRLNPNPSPLEHRSVRLLLGLLVGAILGVAATWLLDAFDRRLRTSKRAEEVFGLPVIAEIPGTQSDSVSAIPVVDVVVDPYSPASEAYRRLHVAILSAPTVTWVRRGYGLQEDFLEFPSRQPQELLVGAPTPAAAPAGPAGADPITPTTGQMRLPVPTRPGGLAVSHRSRFSILVTSPTDEPTRSLVVVNLAAVFAEAGDRVLVATTGGMRTSFDANGKLPPTWEGPYSDLDASDLVANARPSQIPGVSSLALGQLFPNPSRLAMNTPALVEAARDVVDVLLLEAPLLTTQDGAALMPSADLVVVVCEAWRTTVNDGLRAQRFLTQHRPPTLGIVMTNMQAEHPSLSGVS